MFRRGRRRGGDGVAVALARSDFWIAFLVLARLALLGLARLALLGFVFTPLGLAFMATARFPMMNQWKCSGLSTKLLLELWRSVGRTGHLIKTRSGCDAAKCASMCCECTTVLMDISELAKKGVHSKLQIAYHRGSELHRAQLYR
jgi:hypothetical protein